MRLTCVNGPSSFSASSSSRAEAGYCPRSYASLPRAKLAARASRSRRSSSARCRRGWEVAWGGRRAQGCAQGRAERST